MHLKNEIFIQYHCYRGQGLLLQRKGLFLFSLMGQLPSVVDVVPDTVEAAGDAYDGSQEGVAHPNGEDRVLLSQALRTADWASGSLADAPAYPKLQYATE